MKNKWTQIKFLTFLTLVCLCLAAAQAFAAPLPRNAAQKPNLPMPALSSTSVLSLKLPPVYPFRDAYEFVPYNMPLAHAVLSITPTRVRQVRVGDNPSAEDFTVDIRLYNDSGDSHSFYNLYWNPFIPMPGRLALYDAQKNYLCDLLESMGGSRSTNISRAWANIPASSYVGKILYRSLPYPTYFVPPGTYYLQMIYLPCFALSPAEAAKISDQNNSEVFRSNAVQITVLPQLPGKPVKVYPTPLDSVFYNF